MCLGYCVLLFFCFCSTVVWLKSGKNRVEMTQVSTENVALVLCGGCWSVNDKNCLRTANVAIMFSKWKKMKIYESKLLSKCFKAHYVSELLSLYEHKLSLLNFSFNFIVHFQAKHVGIAKKKCFSKMSITQPQTSFNLFGSKRHKIAASAVCCGV